jgi:hypothetical protein
VNWNEDELESWTRALVEKDRRVFGISVSFEPGRFVGTHAYDDYCLYVYEHAGGLASRQLLPPSYPEPLYRERDWYTVAKNTGRRSWSEPYLGERANKTPMLTYSCPFSRDGEFSGVVAADLSIQYFRELHQRLQKQYLGPNCSSFVISTGGTFLYHSNSAYEFPSAASSLDHLQASSDTLALIESMRDQDAGWARGTDFDSGRSATFYFARIPATGGHFVLVQLQSDAAEGLVDRQAAGSSN